MIGIIDYGMGNLRSVQKAFEHVGAGALILSEADQISRADKLVLPGVGAFADGMAHLAQRGWPDTIRAFIADGKPFLGICLGMQLLLDGSEEYAPSPNQLTEGLSILPGKVIRFRRPATGTPRIKIPHMGWNTLAWERDDPLFAGLEQQCAVYFVHSYFAMPQESPDAPTICARTEYAGTFCSSVWRDNIWATQFHPEKSQKVGLKMIANFAAI